jgi:hypothetical protein
MIIWSFAWEVAIYKNQVAPKKLLSTTDYTDFQKFFIFERWGELHKT